MPLTLSLAEISCAVTTGEIFVLATSLCPTPQLQQWPFLCSSGAIRTKRIRSTLRESVLTYGKLSVGATRLENGLAALEVDLNEGHVELFASKEDHMGKLYCSRYLSTAYQLYWRSMGLCYANPSFSQLTNVLTKIALEGGRVVLCTPDWGTTEEHPYWRRLLDHMTVGRTELPNGPVYVPEDSQETMLAFEGISFLSNVDGSLNSVPVGDLDWEVLNELIAKN